jgi:23S rRNA A1618 N6-methylase RlmF
MSKKVWALCAFLLAICVGISQWHLSLVQDKHALEIEGWHYVSEALCDRIDERDDYILLLEDLLKSMVTEPEIDDAELPTT